MARSAGMRESMGYKEEDCEIAQLENTGFNRLGKLVLGRVFKKRLCLRVKKENRLLYKLGIAHRGQ